MSKKREHRALPGGTGVMLYRDAVVLGFEYIETFQKNKERSTCVEAWKHEGAGCVQEALKSILLGHRCGEREERAREAGDEAAEEYVWVTSAMVLPSKCELGPLGNGGHWRRLNE